MNVFGRHGTYFECDDYAHSGKPVWIRTAEGAELSIPTSDLMAFAQELAKQHDEMPIEVNARAKAFIHAAAEAAVEGERAVVQNLIRALFCEIHDPEQSPIETIGKIEMRLEEYQKRFVTKPILPTEPNREP